MALPAHQELTVSLILNNLVLGHLFSSEFNENCFKSSVFAAYTAYLTPTGTDPHKVSLERTELSYLGQEKRVFNTRPWWLVFPMAHQSLPDGLKLYPFFWVG
jgi:hypothetical protein